MTLWYKRKQNTAQYQKWLGLKKQLDHKQALLKELWESYSEDLFWEDLLSTMEDEYFHDYSEQMNIMAHIRKARIDIAKLQRMVL